MTQNLTLASTSAIRKNILENAGLKVASVAPKVDEDAAKIKLIDKSPQQLALGLAELKALSLQKPNELIIGADQTLSCNDILFNKPESVAAAREQLHQLRGKAHTLHSALACAENGKITWSICVDATLTMRNFSDACLDHYISECGADIITSVGSYKLEKQGVRLFEKIDGDYFTILGLPLLPLLAFLRSTGHIAS